MHRTCFSAVMLVCGLAAFASAGDLEPSAPPGPTMKSLDEVPPTWSQRLNSTDGSTNPLILGCGSSRFDCIWTSGNPVPLPTAVLDKETGLVWERSPDNSLGPWYFAVRHCHIVEVGGRRGWRLPTVEELASLIDLSQSSPALPDGHPFFGVHFVGAESYWTQTIDPQEADEAWCITFETGGMNVQLQNTGRYVWCVRGGHGTAGF